MDQLWLPKTQAVLVEVSQEVEEDRALWNYAKAVETSMAVLDVSGIGQDGVGSKTEKTLIDFGAGYAKSNRSTCKSCMEKIEKVRAWGLVCLTFWVSCTGCHWIAQKEKENRALGAG